MWCDNCLLVFPLRGGAIGASPTISVRGEWKLKQCRPIPFSALAVFIAAYNLACSIFLFNYGLLLFSVFPEAQICRSRLAKPLIRRELTHRCGLDGGIGMASMSICIIAVLAFSNNSFMFTRLVFYVSLRASKL